MFELISNAVFVVVGFLLYEIGRWSGRRDRARPSTAAGIRDQLRAYRAMGYDAEQAEKLCREMYATGMRKFGAWSAES